MTTKIVVGPVGYGEGLKVLLGGGDGGSLGWGRHEEVDCSGLLQDAGFWFLLELVEAVLAGGLAVGVGLMGCLGW